MAQTASPTNLPVSPSKLVRQRKERERNHNGSKTHRNNRVTLHTILITVVGTPYTVAPLYKLGLAKRKALKLATNLHCHAVKTVTKTADTKQASKISIRVLPTSSDWRGRLLDGLLAGGQDASLQGWLAPRPIRISLVAPSCASH
eukprot:410129-Pelagomonas_calceolata.AAC.1